MKLAYREWKTRVAESKSVLAAAPADLHLAKEYWGLISGRFGFDVRDGKRLVDTFRSSALKSDEGLAAFIHAFRGLVDETGELPCSALFDPPLENRIRLVARFAEPNLRGDAAWILSFLDGDESFG